jgi:hypothetical protein
MRLGIMAADPTQYQVLFRCCAAYRIGHYKLSSKINNELFIFNPLMLSAERTQNTATTPSRQR